MSLTQKNLPHYHIGSERGLFLFKPSGKRFYTNSNFESGVETVLFGFSQGQIKLIFFISGVAEISAALGGGS